MSFFLTFCSSHGIFLPFSLLCKEHMDQRLAKSIPSALCSMHAIAYANESFLGLVSSQVVCSFHLET
jgi:hypothetical protein